MVRTGPLNTAVCGVFKAVASIQSQLLYKIQCLPPSSRAIEVGQLPAGPPLHIQVCPDPSSPTASSRQLSSGASRFPDTRLPVRQAPSQDLLDSRAAFITDHCGGQLPTGFQEPLIAVPPSLISRQQGPARFFLASVRPFFRCSLRRLYFALY